MPLSANRRLLREKPHGWPFVEGFSQENDLNMTADSWQHYGLSQRVIRRRQTRKMISARSNCTSFVARPCALAAHD